MSLIYRSEKGEILFSDQGFVEFIAGEHRSFDHSDIQEMCEAIIRAGLSDILLLISRFNEYGVPEDFNTMKFEPHAGLTIRKVAYFAPSPGDRTFSQLMKMTAFQDIPCDIFESRSAAIQWLLSEKVD